MEKISPSAGLSSIEIHEGHVMLSADVSMKLFKDNVLTFANRFVFPDSFEVVGYGCMTCIGNSGPLPEPVTEAITQVPTSQMYRFTYSSSH